MKNITIFILLIALTTLTACGGGGGGGSSSGPTYTGGDINGIYDGTYTDSTGTWTLSAMINDGYAMFVAWDDGIIFEGGVSTDGAKFNGTLNAYADGYGYVGTVELSGSYSEGSKMVGSYTTSEGDTGTFNMPFYPVYNRTSSLGKISGTYSAVGSGSTYTIDAGGVMSGTNDLNGCSFLGNHMIIDPNKNLYDVSMAVSGCTNPSYNGTYQGYSFLDDFDGTNDALWVSLTNSDYISLDILLR